MTDFVEYIPRRHGQKPDYWTPDTLTGLDNKNYVRQPNWAWIAGTTYYVPYEAVHGRPRADAMDQLIAQDADLIDDYQCGALAERAKIVAWLRELSGYDRTTLTFQDRRLAYQLAALEFSNAIEAGEHETFTHPDNM